MGLKELKELCSPGPRALPESNSGAALPLPTVGRARPDPSYPRLDALASSRAAAVRRRALPGQGALGSTLWCRGLGGSLLDGRSRHT